MGRTTLTHFRQMKEKGEKIAAVTVYDCGSARLAEEAGIELLLVGDSLGMVLLGYNSTVPVTMREMLHHCQAVARGTQKAFLICDMPFLSFQLGTEKAVANAGRLVKQGGCDAVKIEGGIEIVDTVGAMSRIGLAVVGHLGLTPQSAAKLGGYRLQGKDEKSAEQIFESAVALQEAGCVMLLLECVPSELAQRISQKLTIPTIGIGAGPHCDAQILVWHDLLGLSPGPYPKFVKPYAQLGEEVKKALGTYSQEVKKGIFPSDIYSYHLSRPVVS